jgi:hypothetical protein
VSERAAVHDAKRCYAGTASPESWSCSLPICVVP